MVAPLDGYENVLCRNTELEVDLANAIAGLKRSQADNEILIGNQANALTAYKRLQEQHERLAEKLHKEELHRQQLIEEHQQQVASWRAQLDAKAREIEGIQAQLPGHSELETLRLQVTEELEGRHQQELEDLRSRLGAEVHRAAEAHRQVELCRLEAEHRQDEVTDQLADQVRQNELKEHSFKRQLSALEEDVRVQKKAADLAGQSSLRADENEARALRLQQALQELECRSDMERRSSAAELLARYEELSAARQRVHELQVQHESQEQARELAVEEAQGLRREVARLAAQLAEVRSVAAAAKPIDDDDDASCREELSHLRRTASAERCQLQHRAQTAEEQLQILQLSLRRVEARCQTLEEERTEWEQEFRQERNEAESASREVLNNLRADMSRCSKEAEAQRQAFYAKERELLRQLEAEKSRAESLSDELVQSQFADKEVDQCLREMRNQHQQRENKAAAESRTQIAALRVELDALHERSERLQRERAEYAAAAEAAQASLQKAEDCCDGLQAETDLLKERLVMDEARWAQAADEGHAAALQVAEEQRGKAMDLLASGHKQQLAKLEAASKRALQKGARKRQELRQNCQELAKRVSQLQHERAPVLAGPVAAVRHHELQGIIERLERNSESLQFSTALAVH